MDKERIQEKADEALFDIIRGYSILGGYGHEFYFKHFSMIEALELENEYNNYLKSALNSGIKGEDALIEDAIKNKKWSINQEEQIKSLIWSIGKLNEAAKKIKDYNQRKSAEQSIEDKKKELLALQKERAKLCSLSAESFAETRKIKKFIFNSLYTDRTLKEKFEESEAFARSEKLFEKIADLNNSVIIANAAYNTCFFELFSLHYRQPEILFENKGLYLTSFQKNLLVYANAILNKLKNVTIPDQISNDPIKILNYTEEKVDSQTSYGIEDLKAKSLQNGGKITAEDFLSK